VTETTPTLWPNWTLPYSIELKFQGSAAASAFKSLERRVAERRELAREVAAQIRDGVPPLQLEQEAFEAKVRAIANAVGPILGDIQSFLAAVGVIESILWPSEARQRRESDGEVQARVERGRAIRDLLGVENTSPLQTTNRGEDDARGGLLHFDEMIDGFIREGGAGKYVSLEIGSAAERTAVLRAGAIRWLDEDTLELWVYGRHRNLREVETALRATIGKIEMRGNVQWARAEGPPSATPRAPSIAFGADIERR
jgi:hypothetical protein